MSREMRRISLRRSVQTQLLLLVTFTVFMAGVGYVFFGIRPSIEHIALSQFRASVVREEGALDKVFRPAEALLKMSHGWIGARPPSLKNPGALNNLFQPVMEAFPQITSMVAGTSSGEGWLLLRLGQDQWRNRMTDISAWGPRHLIIDRERVGQHAPSVMRHWEVLDYDPRKRPWFVDADPDSPPGTMSWTVPYLFYTTHDPGITASTAWRMPDGEKFAVGLDLKLRDLSDATMSAQVGKHGFELVLTTAGRVLSLPARPSNVQPHDWFGQLLRPYSRLGLRPLDMAMRHWRKSGGFERNILRFHVDGQPWLALAYPYRIGGQNFWVLNLAKEADFYPDWLPLGAMFLASLLGVLLLAMMVGRNIVRRFALPLESIASASTRIAQLDFSKPEPVATEIREIQQLVQSHETMCDVLQEYQQKVASQEKGLRQQIEALRLAEAKLRESESYNKVLFSESRIPLVVMDPANGRILDCNQAAIHLYRLSRREDLVGRSPLTVSAPIQYDGTPSAKAGRKYVGLALKHGAQTFEWRHRRADGTEWDGEVYLMAFRHGAKTLLQFSVEDITDRKRAAQLLDHYAFYDPLTGLPNRGLFLDRLSQAMGSAIAQKSSLALLFLDLDRFKEINDTSGHATGDQVLVAVAEQLGEALSREHTLARIGGDEFAVLAMGADRKGALDIAERLQLALRQSLTINGKQYLLHVSIGIGLFPDHGETTDELVKNTDIAMYQAKDQGGNHRIYAPDMSEGLSERMSLAQDLRRTLHAETPDLELFYQPQIDLRTRKVIGAEALIRWRHPQRGLISPATFIPLAEERGMMVELGSWVQREAARQLQVWRTAGRVLPGRLSVNVAAQQLDDADLLVRLTDVLAHYGLAAEQFELEITESGLMQNIAQAPALMAQLRAAGFQIAIDDFGTGYSSLAYIKRFPADKIKIDMSFVRDMVEDRSAYAIVATIISMGRNLGLKTIAEGVETRAQAEMLLAMGCDQGQGYLFDAPLPSDAFADKWLPVQREPPTASSGPTETCG